MTDPNAVNAGAEGARAPVGRDASAEERLERAETWFHRLSGLGDEERANVLRDLAATDEALARDVASLLAAHDSGAGAFDRVAARFTPGRPTDAATDPAAATPESAVPEVRHPILPGQILGRYRVVGELGRGGMSTVYLAERADEQFRRRVAVKIIRAGPNAAILDARFQVERQLLASLDHPNIARLLDAGRAPDGRPFLVMEYVRGLPIDEYCDQHRLPLDERIRLAMKVMEAVALAHRSLVVHRDLKPGNILVDEDGSPKLLDFGIAKLLAGPVGEMGRPLTRLGQLPLTPEYSSPEQVRGTLLTTASDVYALGVLLYELLCGHHPHRSGRTSTQELVGSIIEGDIVMPSRRVTETDGFVALRGRRRRVTQRRVAAARRLNVEQLARRLDGDLDAIVMRALRQDPRDRYSSADDLWRDLDRCLQGLPVEARPPGRGYRARKFLLRHRTETAAAAIVVASLLVGSAVAVWQASQARAERDQAVSARARAEDALVRAQTVSAALADLFEAGDPWLLRPVDVASSRNLLDLGLARVEALAGLPLVQADLLDVLARVHANLGNVTEAETLALRALALRDSTGTADDVTAAASLNGLALVRRLQGRVTESASLSRQALTLQVMQLGEDHPDVAETLTLLARSVPPEEAEELYVRALEIRRTSSGSADPLIADALMNVGKVRRTLGRPGEAEAAYQESLSIRQAALGPDHPDVAETLVYLAELRVRFANDPAGAEDMYRRALSIQRRALGDQHPRLTHVLENLATVRASLGDHGEAEQLLREGLEIRRQVFGDRSEAVAVGLGVLGRELMRQARFTEAEETYREALSLLTATGTPDTWSWPATGGLTDLASALVELGEFEEAEALYLQALEIRKRIRGEAHSGVGGALALLGQLHARKGDLDRAVSLYEQALVILLKSTSPLHPDVRRFRRELGDVHAARGEPGLASHYYHLADDIGPG